MMGGMEAPCVPLQNILTIQATLPDQHCPRVELRASSRGAAELALAAVNIGTGHNLWSKLFELKTAGWRPGRQTAMLHRVLRVIQDPAVEARIKQRAEKAARAATPPTRGRRR